MNIFGLWLTPTSSLNISDIILIIVLLFSFVYTVYKSLTRLFTEQNKTSRVVSVLLLNVFAYGALLLLLWTPLKEKQTDNEVILLTKGYQLSDSNINSIKRMYLLSNHAISKHSISNNAIPNQSNANQTLSPTVAERMIVIKDIGQLVMHEPLMKTLLLNGMGLSTKQWAKLPEEVQVKQVFRPKIVGLIDPVWSKQGEVGQAWQFTSNFVDKVSAHAESNAIYTVKLTDFTGKELATKRIHNHETFTLTTRLKAVGATQYNIDILDDTGAQLVREIINIFVNPSNAVLKMFIIQGAPSFETRHMMAWATQFNSQLVIQSQLSKQRYLTQKVNLSDEEVAALSIRTDQNALNKTLLDWADLLVIDGRTYAAMTLEKKKLLNNAIEKGLGVLLQADESFYQYWLKGGKGSDKLLSKVVLDKNDEKRFAFAHWHEGSSEHALAISKIKLNSRQSTTLVKSDSGQSLVEMYPYGVGALAISNLSQLYRLAITGDQQNFSHFWQMISKNIAKASNKTRLLPEPENYIARVNQKNRVCVLSSKQIKSADMLSIKNNKTQSIKLVTDRLGAPMACGTSWLTNDGWYKVSQNNNIQYRYVYQQNNWQVAADSGVIKETVNFISNQKKQKQKTSNLSLVREPLDNFWFWLIFVLSSSLLWFERKLAADKPLS